MKIKRVLATAIGFIALALGTIGIFLPLLPTTPFVLLAAICFSYGSQRFYKWIKRNRYFGPYIENYYEKKGLKMSFKIRTIILLWVSLGISMILIQTFWVYILLCIIGAGVTTHLLLTKTKVDPFAKSFQR